MNVSDPRRDSQSIRAKHRHRLSACCAIEGVDSAQGRNWKLCYFLLTNHNQTVMVSCMKSANANHLFRALADPTRRAIFEELTRQGEQTVHALTRYAGVSQPAVSKHLTVLKRAKLVRHRREGRETHYRAEPNALAPMVDWLRHYGAFWGDRFDRLEALLERME
jgi:DNA-binding transcriptional ArsR family regulator